MNKRDRVFRILPDGAVEGLYSDDFAIHGENQVQRASRVEFNLEHQGWTVEILVSQFAGCFLSKLYARRDDALTDEVAFLNDLILQGEL